MAEGRVPKLQLRRELGVCGRLRLMLCLPELLQRLQIQFQHQAILKPMLHEPQQLLLWEQTAASRCSKHSRKRRRAFNTGMH